MGSRGSLGPRRRIEWEAPGPRRARAPPHLTFADRIPQFLLLLLLRRRHGYRCQPRRRRRRRRRNRHRRRRRRRRPRRRPVTPQSRFNLSNRAARAAHPTRGAHRGTRISLAAPVSSRPRPFLPTSSTEVFRAPSGPLRGASQGISDQMNSRMISTRFRSSSSHTLARFELKANVCSQILITYLPR